MVSIPDWSRFQRLGDFSQKESSSPRSRYYKQREEEAIKQAEEHGYFLDATRSFLEDTFLPEEEEEDDILNIEAILRQEKKEKDLSQIFLIQLSYSHLKTIGDIGLCANLTICILNNNFVKRFDDLIGCLFLMKLDLSCNQISTLPGPTFWSALQFLKCLHLHDNPIGGIENLQYLSSCLSLAILTMYDTPLSLRKNYRHHVVNSIWTLKALDNFVISDEEIIEDAEFGGRFSTLHSSFSIEVNQQSLEESTYESEVYKLNQVLKQINHIMAHNSPVLIVQRYIRGYLVRTRIGKIKHSQLKTQTDKQKREKVKQTYDAPPPVSPISTGRTEMAPFDNTSVIGDSTKIDYDTYMLNRRPGSIAAGSDASIFTGRYGIEVTNSLPVSATERERNRKKNIFINLTKLQSGTLQNLHDESIAMETMVPDKAPSIKKETKQICDTRPSKKRFTKDNSHKKKLIKDIRHFFGPVVDTVYSPEPDDEDSDVPIVDFRLRGLKKQIRLTDPTMEILLARREIGQDIRHAEYEYHYQLENVQKPTIKREKTMNIDQRLFNKVQGTMGLSCLNAINQAYKDREQIEQKTAKLEYVLSMRDQREKAKQRIKLYKEELRNKALQQRAGDHKKIIDAVEKRELHRLNHIDKKGQQRHRLSLESREKRRELTFVHDFNVQNTSVSNALLRHDRQAQQEDKFNKNSTLVGGYKTAEKEQQEIVKKYMEHRTLMRQTESAMSRATLDTRMLQEANDRLMQAKSRVAQQKAKSANVKAAVPTITSPILPPVSTRRLGGLDVRGLDRCTTDLMYTSAMPPGRMFKTRSISASVV